MVRLRYLPLTLLLGLAIAAYGACSVPTKTPTERATTDPCSKADVDAWFEGSIKVMKEFGRGLPSVEARMEAASNAGEASAAASSMARLHWTAVADFKLLRPPPCLTTLHNLQIQAWNARAQAFDAFSVGDFEAGDQYAAEAESYSQLMDGEVRRLEAVYGWDF